MAKIGQTMQKNSGEAKNGSMGFYLIESMVKIKE